MHLLSCRYPLKQEVGLLQRAPSTMGAFMQNRSWLSVVLPGLIYLSLGMPAQVHAAISEPNKKLFSSAMKAARSGDYYQANRTFRDLLKTCSDWGLVYLQLGVLELDTNPARQLDPDDDNIRLGVEQALQLCTYRGPSPFQQRLPRLWSCDG